MCTSIRGLSTLIPKSVSNWARVYATVTQQTSKTTTKLLSQLFLQRYLLPSPHFGNHKRSEDVLRYVSSASGSSLPCRSCNRCVGDQWLVRPFPYARLVCRYRVRGLHFQAIGFARSRPNVCINTQIYSCLNDTNALHWCRIHGPIPPTSSGAQKSQEHPKDKDSAQ